MKIKAEKKQALQTLNDIQNWFKCLPYLLILCLSILPYKAKEKLETTLSYTTAHFLSPAALSPSMLNGSKQSFSQQFHSPCLSWVNVAVESSETYI